MVPPSTRLVAEDSNATNRPSALIEIEGSSLDPFPSIPAVETLTRVVTLVRRSRTNMSSNPFISPDTRLVAPDANATYRPSALIDGE